MKAKVIKRANEELLLLLKEKEKLVLDFPKIGGDRWLNTPISPPKAFVFTILACNKYKRKLPKISFISSKTKKHGINFNEVRRIFLIRHDVKTFVQQMAEYINPHNNKLFPQLMQLWEEKEDSTWIEV